MNSNQIFKLVRRTARIAAICLLAVFLFIAFTDVSEATSPPTVNGLFYGDGDLDRYGFYSISDRGSELYYRLEGSTLYVALVVAREVNDNVFGNPAYMIDAGWPASNPRNARRLVDSEFMEFTMSACGDSWTWKQGYGRQTNHTNVNNSTFTEATWVSNHLIATGSGTPPPGYFSSSSWVANLNNYANNYPANPFNMGINGTTITEWKSAFDATSPDQVVGLEGYPATGPITWNSTYEWEWPVVYEWSANLDGPGCAGVPISINAVSSHHSPSKDLLGDNDPFPPPPNDGVLTDWGDLPSGYPTTFADNGPRHQVVVGGAYLGLVAPDVEPDGSPDIFAQGDDSVIVALNDEDGVRFPDGFTLIGSEYRAPVEVIAGANGCISAFIDINGDGTLSQAYIDVGGSLVALSDYCVTAGTYNWTIVVLTADEPGAAGPQTAVRFRITNLAGQGGASPTGLAITGEIEDLLIVTPTAISLRNVSTSASSVGLTAALVVALVGLGLTSLYVVNRRQRPA